MEEWGVGPIREGDGEWDDWLDEHWDGKVKISGVSFITAREVFASQVLTEASPVVVATMSMEFGPATEILDPDGIPRSIGQVLHFKVFDSHGEAISLSSVHKTFSPLTSTRSSKRRQATKTS